MFNKEKVKLGIAPIAWTNDDMPDLGKENTFEQCVSEMALAGFTGSEVEQIPQGYGGAEKGIAVVGNGNLQPVVFLLFDYEAFRRGGEGV